jgi:hypothetical protein
VEFNKRKMELSQNLQEAIMKPIARTPEISCPTYLKAAGEYIYNLKIP